MVQALCTMKVFELLQTIKEIATDCQNIKDLNITHQGVKLSSVVTELSVHLAQERGKIAVLVQENSRMKANLKVQELRAKIQRIGRYYYLLENSTTWPNTNFPSEGPFCIRCLDYDEKLVTVTVVTKTENDEGFCCPKCDCN